MKRILSLVLAMSMVLSLCACGGKNGENDSSSSKAGTSTGDNSGAGSASGSSQGAGDSSQSAGGIEVDSNLFDVTITIPADFLGEDATQEKLDEEAKEDGIKSITLNADGSATYVMTKAKHREMMDGIRQSIDEGLKDMESSEDYPDIVSAKANNDYTQFIVTMNTEELGLENAFLPLVFYIYSGMYHAFNGTEPGNVNIQFVSAASGEVIEEYNSDDME